MANEYKSYRKEYEQWLQENLALAVEAVAADIWSEAKLYHTFNNQTGELEKSIRIKKEKVDNKLVHYSVRAGVGKSGGVGTRNIGEGGSTQAYYAIYVELGTVKMQAKPFLRPALKKYEKTFIKTIKKIYKAGERKYRIR